MNFIIFLLGLLIFSSLVYLIYNWNSPQSASNLDEIIYFYKDGCGACTMFDKTWMTLANDTNYKLKKVDIMHNEDMSFYYNVTATPTIILKKNNKWDKLEGHRDVRTLLEEINLFEKGFEN